MGRPAVYDPHVVGNVVKDHLDWYGPCTMHSIRAAVGRFYRMHDIKEPSAATVQRNVSKLVKSKELELENVPITGGSTIHYRLPGQPSTYEEWDDEDWGNPWPEGETFALPDEADYSDLSDEIHLLASTFFRKGTLFFDEVIAFLEELKEEE